MFKNLRPAVNRQPGNRGDTLRAVHAFPRLLFLMRFLFFCIMIIIREEAADYRGRRGRGADDSKQPRPFDGARRPLGRTAASVGCSAAFVGTRLRSAAGRSHPSAVRLHGHVCRPLGPVSRLHDQVRRRATAANATRAPSAKQTPPQFFTLFRMVLTSSPGKICKSSKI